MGFSTRIGTSYIHEITEKWCLNFATSRRAFLDLFEACQENLLWEAVSLIPFLIPLTDDGEGSSNDVDVFVQNALD